MPAPAIKNIGLELTTRCSLACLHCDRADSINAGILASNGDMSADVFDRASWFIRQSPRWINLSAGLGESFILKNLEDVVYAIKEQGHSPYLYTSLQNFSRAARIVELFEAGLQRIFVSVDRWHLQELSKKFSDDELRVLVSQGLDLINRSGYIARISANVVIDSCNWKQDVQALLPYLKEWRFKRLEIKWRYPLVSYDSLDRFRQEILALLEEHETDVYLQNPSELAGCSEVNNSVHINYDGKLRICCVHRDWTIEQSVFDYDSVEDLQASPAYEDLVTGIDQMMFSDRCLRCPNKVVA